MTDPEKSSGPSDDLLREALRWVLRLHSGQVSQADIDAVKRWRAASAAHRQAFAEANLRLDLVRTAAGNMTKKSDVAGLDQGSLKRRLLTRRAVAGGAAAAAAAGALYAAVHPPLGLWPAPGELMADYRTTTGEQRKVSFAGDVSVEMNTRTSLSVGAAEAEASQIQLIAGEIAVATTTTSVTVIAGQGRTSATHAAFDLRREGSRVSVTCLSGTVAVECRGGAATLQPRQQIAYDEQALSSIGSVDPGIVEAWRQGLLVFENQPLSRVIEEINRYRRGRIILLDAALGRLPLDATFRLDRIDEAVPKIAHVFGAKVRSLPGGIVLLG
jgi:transmembrane sensor